MSCDGPRPGASRARVRVRVAITCPCMGFLIQATETATERNLKTATLQLISGLLFSDLRRTFQGTFGA